VKQLKLTSKKFFDLKRDNFSSSRRAKILTAGILVVFRGLKFEPNAEIGKISLFN